MAALDHPWDETYPADLTQASFFAAALRAFKIDVRQRMVAFGAGPLGDRPVPDASFGGANDGVTYQATDTGQTFRYNGAAWVDITPSGFGRRLLYATGATVAISGAGLGVNFTLAQYVLPANTIPLGKVLHYVIDYGFANGPNNIWVQVGTFSGQIIHSYQTPIAEAPTSQGSYEGYIINAVNGPVLLNRPGVDIPQAGVPPVFIAGGVTNLNPIDFTKDQTFLFQGQVNAADQLRINAALIEALY